MRERAAGEPCGAAHSTFESDGAAALAKLIPTFDDGIPFLGAGARVEDGRVGQELALYIEVEERARDGTMGPSRDDAAFGGSA